MAELVDDWPSLAPIRTSCTTSSYCCEANNPTNPINPTTNPFSLSHRTDHYQFQPPSSISSSSTVSFLHVSSSTARGHHLISKCFPPRPNPSHAFPKAAAAIASPGRDFRRSHAGGIFQSFASFPGPVQRRRTPISGASNHSGPLKLGHSGPLKGYNNGSKGGNNSFTMIPVNVVGKEKPPDYVPDEPTSPEVTCMGRVRRNKQCKAWDALLSTEKQLRNQKSKRLESPRRISDLQLSIPKPLSAAGSSPTMASTWKKMLGLIKDIKGLQSSHLQRKLRQEDLIIDLSRFCSESETAARDRIPSRSEADHGDGFFYINPVSQSGEGDEESSVVEEDGIHILSDVPPPNCLLLMRNSSRSKVFHSHDDDDNDQGLESNQLQGNPIALKLSPAGDEISWKRSNPPLALKPYPADEIARKRREAFQFLKNKRQSFPSSRHLLTR